MSHTIPIMRKRDPMWVYEKNYAYLVKLLAELINNTEGSVVASTEVSEIKATLIENCRYTQVIELRETGESDNEYLKGIRLRVRIYHDAQLAEVIAYQGNARLRARYSYPNEKMYYPDEKRQVNYLLHEWLHNLRAADFRNDETCAYVDM